MPTTATRLLISGATYLVTLATVAAIAFCLVILLAGPHGGMLPHALGGVVLILGYALVLLLPLFAACAMWRRLGKTAPSSHPGRGVDRSE
jgi:hypothetical protein